MWKIGARDAALPFVAAAALIGATHVAPAVARFGAAAAHHGAAAPRAVGYSAHMGGPRGGLPRADAGAHSSAAGRVTSPSLSRPTFHANRLAGRSSAGSLRGHGPTTARTVHSRKSAAPAKRVGGNAPELRRRTAAPAYVRPRYHGGFTGWSGPLFWPHAYDDIFDYTFWPYDFDQIFWAYAYADVYNSIVWPYGDSVGSIGVPGGPPRLTRSRTGTPAGQAPDIAQLCGDRTPGLTDWPIERIEQTVAPMQAQQAALLELKSASAKAAEALHAACPIDGVASPLARLDAMEKRLDAMLRAVDLVRPALESFYDSLRDEQKARFNAIGYASKAPQRETGAARQGERRSHTTHFCSSDHGAALSRQSARRIERAVHPTESQRGALDDLREASARAIATLRSACPNGIPATPLARLDILDKRLDAMAQAVKIIRPAMQHFYDLLGEEQKVVFNAIGLRENAIGSGEATSGEAR
jgi:hypothetical protein